MVIKSSFITLANFLRILYLDEGRILVILHKKIIIVCISIVLVVVISIGVYWYYHPTHYKYNDRFIIGSNVSQIVDKYGEFDIVFDNLDKTKFSGGYLVKPERVGFLGTDWPEYYMILFENDIAIKVEIEIGGWGG